MTASLTGGCKTITRAAIRETQEEFGITPLNPKRVGQITGFEGGKYGEPYIYLCTEFEGEPKASEEIKSPTFYPLDEIPDGMPGTWTLFPPFEESLKFLDKAGNLQKVDGGPGSGRYPKGSGGETSMVNPSGANEFKVQGFRNKQKLNNHFQNHQKDYHGMTKEQYEARALELVQKPVGNGILGHVDKDGQITRYDEAKNEFVKGHPDRGINTLFKPEPGRAYYDKMREDDLNNGGRE